MDNQVSYAKVVAIAKKMASEMGGGSGSGGTGGVSQDEFDLHILDNKRHLTAEDRKILVKVDQYKGYCSTTVEIPKEGIEGDYILVGETNSFWVYDKISKEYVNTATDIEAYDDTFIKSEIQNLKEEIENQTMRALTNLELDALLQ